MVRLEDLLRGRESDPLFLLFALVAAFFLGAAHALTPGHGKTLVAAYLVGSRGRIADAFYLGSVVTVTHTASVFILGLATLYASSMLPLNRILPVLSLISGALVLGIGGWLLWQRLTGRGHHHHHDHGHGHSHDHAHDHAHAHSHEHGAIGHSHASEHAHEHTHDHAHAHSHEHGAVGHSHASEHTHEHTHDRAHAHSHEHGAIGHSHASEHAHDHPHDHVQAHPEPEHAHSHSHEHSQEHVHSHGPAHTHSHSHEHSHGHSHSHSHVSRGGLLSLGISGGLVPCPEALVVLMLSVSLGRIAFGLALLSAFTVGLAAVLIAIGCAMVLAGPMMQRFSGEGRITKSLPVASACVVTILGALMVREALLTL